MITYHNLISEKYLILNMSYFTEWLMQVIDIEGYKAGEIVYIFMSDSELIKINNKYLKHDTYTDIITFKESVNQKIISGEIFISLERVVDNAKTFSINIENEFSRVLVHGVLHLLGYDDKTDEEKSIMRTKENYYINLQSNKFDKLFHVKH